MSDYFDQEAATWDAKPERSERADAVAQGIRARLPLSPQWTALEYGCGTGLLSFALQPDLAHITLVDSSRGMLAVLDQKIASAGIPNLTPLYADFLNDPLPPLKVNLIYTLMVLHHIPDTDGILKAFSALLSSPGYLCVADLDQEDGTFHDHDFSGHKGFERAELAEKARQAGFGRVEFSTVFQVPRPVAGTIRNFPLFLMVAEKTG
jgi:ubiquinone/menaquinone biosynthesis C-methylase UbiE